MPKPPIAALLLACLIGCAQACTCMRQESEAAVWRDQWAEAEAVVLAVISGGSSEPRTRWLSRDHVLGHSSPLQRRRLLHLVVRHRWKGELVDGAAFVVEEVDGAMCGYESWARSREHLLYLSRHGHWRASLCSPSRPAANPALAIREMDAELARHLGRTESASR